MSFSSISGSSKTLSNRSGIRQTGRWTLGLLALSFLFALACTTAAASTNSPSSSSSVQPSLPFAIADFDGDLRPDLASVQIGTNGASSSDYWIQLRLSSLGQQSIRLVAPVGGLEIEARDVNGDHAVDLVLSTLWLRQPVAVLLNDGHGRFSTVEPSAFPGAFTGTSADLTSTNDLGADVVGIAPQSRVSTFSRNTESVRDRSPSRLIIPRNESVLSDPFSLSHSGRAPPCRIYCV